MESKGAFTLSHNNPPTSTSCVKPSLKSGVPSHNNLYLILCVLCDDAVIKFPWLTKVLSLIMYFEIISVYFFKGIKTATYWQHCTTHKPVLHEFGSQRLIAYTYTWKPGTYLVMTKWAQNTTRIFDYMKALVTNDYTIRRPVMAVLPAVLLSNMKWMLI